MPKRDSTLRQGLETSDGYKERPLICGMEKEGGLRNTNGIESTSPPLLSPRTEQTFRYGKKGQSIINLWRVMEDDKRDFGMCESCRTYTKRKLRFRAPVSPDHIVFNHEFEMGFVWLERKTILHIVDTHTNVQNAFPMRYKMIEDVWYALDEWWASLYVD